MVDLPAEEVLAAVFGDRAPLARRYADWLADVGVTAGLIGPREAERLWERHILNSAAVAELVPDGARVADVGSGAGLPGIPLALAKPEARVALVEPLARRTGPVQAFLDEVGLPVDVVQARAESAQARERLAPVQVVVSRAVAALDTLARWSSPLLSANGVLLAIKGRTAEDELSRCAPALRAMGFGQGEVVSCGTWETNPAPRATVVVLRRTAGPRRRSDRD